VKDGRAGHLTDECAAAEERRARVVEAVAADGEAPEPVAIGVGPVTSGVGVEPARALVASLM
jgi:hypothetical protein